MIKKFLRLYKWELNNELFGGLHFAAMLSMYCIILLIHGERSVDIIIMLEMLLVCYAISTFQVIIFSEDKSYSKNTLFVKTGVWFIFSMLLIMIISIVFQWFDHMEAWAVVSFLIYMVIYLITIWIGIHIANKVDSKNLNHMLSDYQNKQVKMNKEDDHDEEHN